MLGSEVDFVAQPLGRGPHRGVGVTEILGFKRLLGLEGLGGFRGCGVEVDRVLGFSVWGLRV